MTDSRESSLSRTPVAAGGSPFNASNASARGRFPPHAFIRDAAILTEQRLCAREVLRNQRACSDIQEADEPADTADEPLDVSDERANAATGYGTEECVNAAKARTVREN